MSVIVEGKIYSVFMPDSPGGKFGMTVVFPTTIGGIAGTNLVSVYITREQALNYANRLDAKVTLTIEEL